VALGDSVYSAHERGAVWHMADLKKLAPKARDFLILLRGALVLPSTHGRADRLVGRGLAVGAVLRKRPCDPGALGFLRSHWAFQASDWRKGRIARRVAGRELGVGAAQWKRSCNLGGRGSHRRHGHFQIRKRLLSWKRVPSLPNHRAGWWGGGGVRKFEWEGRGGHGGGGGRGLVPDLQNKFLPHSRNEKISWGIATVSGENFPVQWGKIRPTLGYL